MAIPIFKESLFQIQTQVGLPSVLIRTMAFKTGSRIFRGSWSYGRPFFIGVVVQLNTGLTPLRLRWVTSAGK